MSSIQLYEDASAASDFGLGLRHVQLSMPPGGEGRCRSFFVDVLGMTEVQKPPALAARDVHGNRLEFLTPGE